VWVAAMLEFERFRWPRWPCVRSHIHHSGREKEQAIWSDYAQGGERLVGV